MVITLHIHRPQRQRAPLKAAQTAFHQIFTAVSQHRLLKRELLFRLIRAVHPPAQPTHRRLQCLLVHPHLHGGLTVLLHIRRPILICSHRVRRGVMIVAKPQEFFDAVMLDHLVRRLA
jgi:hypothetical protein